MGWRLPFLRRHGGSELTLADLEYVGVRGILDI
jgi:hypothetical protein